MPQSPAIPAHNFQVLSVHSITAERFTDNFPFSTIFEIGTRKVMYIGSYSFFRNSKSVKTYISFKKKRSREQEKKIYGSGRKKFFLLVKHTCEFFDWNS